MDLGEEQQEETSTQILNGFNETMYSAFVFPATFVTSAFANIKSWVATHTISCTICLCVTITATFSAASLAIGLGIGLGVGCAQTRIVQTNSNSG